MTDFEPIRLTEGTAEKAAEHLDPDSAERIDRLMALVEGFQTRFQTPYSLELLATAHFAASHEPVATELDEISTRVASWNLRKAACSPRATSRSLSSGSASTHCSRPDHPPSWLDRRLIAELQVPVRSPRSAIPRNCGNDTRNSRRPAEPDNARPETPHIARKMARRSVSGTGQALYRE